MSRLDAHVDRIAQHRSELERAWASLDGAWRDDRRRTFDRTHMQVLLRTTHDTVTALRSSAQLIASAVRSLR